MRTRLLPDRVAVFVVAIALSISRLPGDDTPAANGVLPPLHVKHGYGIKGLVLWLAADGGVTSDTQGQVTKLVDRTANFTLTTPNGIPGPTLVPKILNGLPVLRFNGTQSLYSPDNFGNTLDHGMTFILVASTKGAAFEEFSLYLGQNAAQGCNRALAILNGKELFDGQWVGCLGEPALNNAFVMTGESINARLSQATFYRNDKLMLTTGLKPDSTSPFGEVSDGITMGAAPVQLYGWNGDIAEALVYDRQLSPAEMQSVWTALSAKYALHSTPASASAPPPSSP